MKNKYANLTITIVLLLILVSISNNIPVLWDDWMWGGEVGINRLNSIFSNYNGRYLGNILVIILTRSNLIKTIIISTSIIAIIYFMYSCFGGKDYIFYIISSLLVLLLPMSIFSQTISWVSGFCNYIPPIVLFLIYFFIIKKEFDDNIVVYKKYQIFLMIILGICMQLFMETNTIYNCIFSVFMVIYVYVKTKRIPLIHISFMTSTLLGAFIMFSNGAYSNIYENEDSYRSVGRSFKEIIVQIYEHYFNYMNRQLFMKSFALNCILAITILLIIKICRKNNKYNLKDYIISIVSISYPTYLLFTIFRIDYIDKIYEKSVYFFDGLFTVLFYIALIVTIIQYIADTNIKLKLLLLVASIVVLTAPLLIVNPLSPRCYLNTYIFMVMLILELLNYIILELDIEFRYINILGAVSLFIIGLVYINIFIDIGKAEKSRQAIVNEQLKSKEINIIIPKLPHGQYLMNANASLRSGWEKNALRNYYTVSKEVTFRMYNLNEEKNLNEYLKNINRENYIALISYKYNEKNVNISNNIKLENKEIVNLLDNNYGDSFLEIRDSGKILFTKNDDNRIDFKDKIDGVNINIVSKSLNNGNSISMKLNNKEFAINKPGINVVVYDKIQKKVIDSVAFDIENKSVANR
ncbi:MAG: hypothetical protein E7208_00130 [Clostridium butyricum]|nr:hypothetical protein [Clostridium butyricum]